MTARIYYAALPFNRSKDGYLIAGEAKECPCAASATEAAERFGTTYAGAVAFSRRMDPAMGTCEAGRLLRKIGEVPKLGYLLGVA